MSGERVAAAVFAAILSLTLAAAAEPSADEQATSFDAVSEDVVVAPDCSFTATIHTEIHAVNEAGAMQASRVSVLYDSETQQLEVVEAHTLKRDGSKIPVDLTAIYEQLPSDNMLAVTSFRAKVILFPQFSAGDTAVYTVQFRNPRAMFAGAFQYGKVFPRNVVFKDARVSITAPKSLSLRVETHDLSFAKEDKADTVVYTWRLAAAADKAMAPALVSPLDRERRFFVSSFKDYGDLGRAYAVQSAPQSAVTPKVQALADQITAGAAVKREQARLIYEWVVSHIRYVAVILGRGSFVPHDADAVIAKGYGDCKDHDVLLQALLKAKGIDAESVLINGENAYTLSEAPTFVQLNHVITYVPEFDVYLDASLSVVPFGVLPLQEYGKPAVRATPKAAGLVQIPLVKPGAAAIHTETIQKIDASGTLSGTTVTTATGPYAIDLRLIGLGVQALGPEKAAELQMTSRGFKEPHGKLVADSLATLGTSYTIRGEFTAKGWESVLNGDGTIMPGGLRLLVMTGNAIMGPLYGDDDTSTEPTICISAKADEDVSLELPAGYAFRMVPEDLRISTPNLTFTTHWTLTGTTMKVRREFTSKIDTPLCAGAVRKQTADALKRIAHSYDDTVDAIRSVEHYSQDLSQNPKDAKTLVGRGVAYEEAGEHEKAIADFDAALAIKPNDAWALFQRAYSYAQLGKSDQAIEDYTKAIAIDGKNAIALGNRGRLYKDQGKYDLAIADFDKALALKPDDSELFGVRGYAYRRTGQYDHAVADLTKAISLKPDNALAHYNLAAVYYSKHQYEPALDEYGKAIALDPNYYYSYWDRAGIYQIYRKFDLALKDLDKALELEPKVVDLWVARADMHISLGHSDAASADAAKALAVDPQSAAALQVRGNIRLSNHQFALAVEDFTTVIAKDPNGIGGYTNRAIAYQFLKDFKRALADVDKAIAIAPNGAMLYFVRAQIKHAMGDHVGGNQDSAKALKLDPKLGK